MSKGERLVKLITKYGFYITKEQAEKALKGGAE